MPIGGGFINGLISDFVKSKYFKKLKENCEEYANENGFQTNTDSNQKLKEVFDEMPFIIGDFIETLSDFTQEYEGLKIRHIQFICRHKQETLDYYSFLTELYTFSLIEDHFKRDIELSVKPEKLADKLMAGAGQNDLDFENKKFSDKYFVEGKPESFAYSFFNPRMMELFLEEELDGIVITNGNVVLYNHREMINQFNAASRYIFKIEPSLEWIQKVPEVFKKIDKNVPKFLNRTLPPILTLECPKCKYEFKVEKGQKKIKCPECWTEGEL